MKSNILEFLRRGLVACGFGPLVLAVIYIILQNQGIVQTLTVNEVSKGIFSMAALAFIAGGSGILYQFERLPLMIAILIHGCVLYTSYLAVYLINGWLKQGATPVLIFTGIFIAGYILIWAIIYPTTRRHTRKLNEKLKLKQQTEKQI